MKHFIRANRFSDVPTYFAWDTARKYPDFAIVDSIKIEIDAPDIDTAYLWALTNLPAHYAVGLGVSNEKGDFLCAPVKGYYYWLNYDEKAIVDCEIKETIETMKKRG